MLNSVKARPKKSHVENIMNVQVFTVFIVQLIFCLFSCLYAAFWYMIKKKELIYLDINPNGIANNAFWFNAVVRFGNWLLIFTFIIIIFIYKFSLFN